MFKKVIIIISALIAVFIVLGIAAKPIILTEINTRAEARAVAEAEEKRRAEERRMSRARVMEYRKQREAKRKKRETLTKDFKAAEMLRRQEQAAKGIKVNKSYNPSKDPIQEGKKR